MLTYLYIFAPEFSIEHIHLNVFQTVNQKITFLLKMSTLSLSVRTDPTIPENMVVSKKDCILTYKLAINHQNCKKYVLMFFYCRKIYILRVFFTRPEGVSKLLVTDLYIGYGSGGS